MKYLLGLVALFAGLAAGDWLPDIDQKTGLLLHRSIVTHGPLVPLVLLAVASGTRSMKLRWFALGLTLGVAVHLSFDLFPKGWSGFALISIPVYGWTNPLFSWTWIAGSVIVCTYLAAKLVRGCLDANVFAWSLVGGFSYVAMSEDTLWRPLVALSIAIAVALIRTARGAMADD